MLSNNVLVFFIFCVLRKENIIYYSYVSYQFYLLYQTIYQTIQYLSSTHPVSQIYTFLYPSSLRPPLSALCPPPSALCTLNQAC